jgi:nucleoside-diphosphate-sugar epimerase
VHLSSDYIIIFLFAGKTNSPLLLMEDIRETLQNKHILITGGCGFLGSEISKQLNHLGANITVLDNLSSGNEKYIRTLKNVELRKGDITDESTVESVMENQDYVIHLAALPFIPDSYTYPKEFFEVNVNGTINLALAAIRKKVKRFVHISSSEVYGTARYTPMDENHPLIPQSTYSVSKLAGERVIYTIHKEHNLPVVIVRPFNSFGPNITQPYIIPEIIHQLLSNTHEVKLGNINSRRDLTFVSDTSKGIINTLVAEGIIGETINLGSERSISIRDLVNLIAEILCKNVSITIDPSRIRPSDVEVLTCDYTKANRLLGWFPTVSVKDGLRITVGWAMEYGITLKAPFKGWPATYRRSFFNDVH